MITRIADDIVRFYYRAQAHQKILYLAGFLLILSGSFHHMILLHEGTPWEGPLSWRKPMLFGLSSGLTAISVGWIMGLAPFRKNLTSLAFSGIFSGAILIEVALISLQTWRGEASHFNGSTPLNFAIYIAIDVLVILIALQIFYLTYHICAVNPIAADPAIIASARTGMILLSLACLFGFWALLHGNMQVKKNLPPEIFGDAGIIKFVHGVPIHAIQHLPLQAWLLALCGLSPSSRLRLTWISASGIAALTLFALIQTLEGRARLDFSPITLPLFAMSILLISMPPLALASSCLLQKNRSR